MTKPTSQVIIPNWTISPLWVGSHIPSPEPSRRLCTKWSMVHPSTGILRSISTPAIGIRSCSTSLTSTSNRPSFQGQLGQLQKAYKEAQGDHTLCLQPQQLLGLGSSSITFLMPYILAPNATLHITNGAIYGNY